MLGTGVDGRTAVGGGIVSRAASVERMMSTPSLDTAASRRRRSTRRQGRELPRSNVATVATAVPKGGIEVPKHRFDASSSSEGKQTASPLSLGLRVALHLL